MPVDPRVTPLVPMHDRFTSEREMLAHARQEADRLGLDDYFVVDVDSHRDPSSAWPEVLRYMENPVMRFNSQHDYEAMGHTQYVPTPGGRGGGGLSGMPIVTVGNPLRPAGDRWRGAPGEGGASA